MGVVLSIIGWFFLIFLALLVLLLLVPLTITVKYSNEGLGLWVRVLFVRLRLFPMKKKDPKKEKKPKEDAEEKKAKPKKEKVKKEKPKKTFGEMAALAKRLIRAGQAAMKVYFKHLRISGIRLVLPLHGADAAATAQKYGRVQAAIGTVRALADGRLHLRFKQIEIFPDFVGQLGHLRYFACKVSFCPGIIIPMGIKFLWIFLKKRPYSKKVYKKALAAKQAAAEAAQKNKVA